MLLCTEAPMHRISLKGPWNLAIIDQQLRCSRKFHAPTGIKLIGDGVKEPLPSSPKIFFGMQLRPDWGQFEVSFNGATILPAIPQASSSPSELPYSERGTYQFELTTIIQRFNEIALTWSVWPSVFEPSEGGYSPSPAHPFHFDSWLEIIEV
jgi:hypothetical protein